MTVLAVSLNEPADAGQFVAGVTSLAVLASVYFVWRQVKQQADDGRVALITGMTTLIGSVSQVFIDAMDHAVEHLHLMSDSTQAHKCWWLGLQKRLAAN